MNNKKIPNLHALLSFVSCAKLKSISKAGQALHKTQGAISRQIKQLEDMYGVRLFDRTLHGMMLTVEGAIFFEKARQVLEMVGQLDSHSIPKRHIVLVRAPSTFALRWLLPRLNDINQIMNDVEIKIDTSFDDSQSQDTENGEITNIFITRGISGLPGHESRRLFPETLVMACSLDMAECVKNHPEDITSLCKLKADKTTNDWERWLHENNLPQGGSGSYITFDTLELVISAAQEGLGLGLIDPRMAEKRIQSGKLYVPYPVEISSGKSYYINIPKKFSSDGNVKIFIDAITELAED